MSEEEHSAAGRPVLELKEIHKSYGYVNALSGVSFDLRAGEVHALMGDNGAGKSTLLKVAAGVVKPDAGEVCIAQEQVQLASPLHARDLGIETVYQDLALADDRSCVANVFMGRETRRKGVMGKLGVLDRGSMTAATQQAFAELSIPVTRVTRPVRVLSGGQRQGVAIARAAIWARNVLLLDEPTAALGVRQRGAVDHLVSSLRSRGFGIMLVSHDVPEVLRVADRVTVLRLGEAVATRPASEVDARWVVTSMVGADVSSV
jgi:simple sugar transport system ATP-binding protein